MPLRIPDEIRLKRWYDARLKWTVVLDDSGHHRTVEMDRIIAEGLGTDEEIVDAMDSYLDACGRADALNAVREVTES